MTHAFAFDASACSGCKACQVACKDKNALPVGVLWRRVYEVAGGGWQQQGQAWTNSIFAYNLSIACNHCVHPKCAGVCPTDAYILRQDGIVIIDEKRCIGCGYCAWACPYDAPQLNGNLGVMTKCNLCADDLDMGLPPACVAACPMRCLELVDTNDTGAKQNGTALWEVAGKQHPFPLPAFSRTEPHVLIYPHKDIKSSEQEAQVTNREEVTVAGGMMDPRKEIPLIIFTLLAQTAFGASWAYLLLATLVAAIGRPVEIMLMPLLATGGLISLAMLLSFLHLGRPLSAWRVLNHLRKSWLSREILWLGLFAGTWGLHAGMSLLRTGIPILEAITAAMTALCGLAGLISMANIYRLRSVPGWNTWRTPYEFVTSTLLLGFSLTNLLLPQDLPPASRTWFLLPTLVAFGATILPAVSFRKETGRTQSTLRLVLSMTGIIATAIAILSPGAWMFWGLMVTTLAFLEEILGRWHFYRRRKPNM